MTEEALKQQVDDLKTQKAHLLGLLQQVIELEDKRHPVVLTPAWFMQARNAIAGVYPKLRMLPRRGDV